MSITIADLQQHAAKLRTADKHECFTRSAISRHYYAAYHRVLQWEQTLPELGFQTDGVGAHEQLIYRLANPSPACSAAQAEKSKNLSGYLRLLKDRRSKADYKLGMTILASEALSQDVAASKLIRYCGNPP